jgi:uncharacterized DUF497 family protein
MRIAGYIWREDVIDKLAWKHQVQVDEVVDDQALIVSARDMTAKERRRYAKK